ncbi:hypothetical protein CISIN_1g035407mg [Citrus sinensis]|uniref:Uncharacterized protein n=1 Tax=Citrus sinensis TaxID=2711 RepID=A0A067ECY0_CITSI|nr:hypothetical protein CISIN_1g035407mg [Citrus sinensis]
MPREKKSFWMELCFFFLPLSLLEAVGSEVDPGAPESISKVMGAVNDKHD